MNYTEEILTNFNEIKPIYLNFSLSLVCLNIRSLRKNFLTFLANMNNIITRVHIIILCETNIVNEENSFYTIDGFNTTFLNREGKGGGIAIYIRDSIQYETINVNITSAEILQVEIQYSTHKTLTILPIYRPPNKSITLFLNEIEQIVYQVSRKNKVILLGDINIDIQKINTNTTKYLSILSSNGLKCMVNTATREGGGSKSCIDHLFIRWDKKLKTAHAAVVTTVISDHHAIFASIEETEHETHKITQNVTDYKINNNRVNTQIRKVNWQELINKSKNTNELFNSIYNTFNQIYENSKCEKPKLKRRKPHPWLTDSILQSCYIRDKLYKKWSQNKNNKTNEIIYKNFNNKLNKEILKAKNRHIFLQFLNNKNNIRGTWKIINEVIGKKTKNLDEHIKLSFKDRNMYEIAENFAINFNQNVINIVHPCNVTTLETRTQRFISNSMFLDYTTESEINNIIKNLNARKGAGMDNIRAIDLKSNADVLTPIVTHLINSSLREASIPQILKESTIRPIYKSGNKSDYANYRPISILPVLEKVLEEIVVRRLTSFLSKYKIINKNQYGFQKNKNINQLLGYFANHINQNLNMHNNSVAIFIDFSKAFDTLAHDKVISVLEQSGIRGHCIQWFKNYLNHRAFSVKINGISSSKKQLLYGVPQGSKLGPILYLIYTNEMTQNLKNSTSFTYADDTAIIISHKNIDNAINLMQEDFNLLTKWCHDMGLIINPSKTKIMHFRSRHVPKSNIRIIYHSNDCIHTKNREINQSLNDQCDTHIELVEEYKYLGVHLDHNFKWKTHIENVQKKLRKSSFALYHLSNCAPYKALRQAYFSLVESQLRHGISAWGNARCCKKLQFTQDRILKLLHKQSQNTHEMQNDNMKLIYKQHNVLNIRQIFAITIASEFSEDPILARKIRHQYNTRRRSEGWYEVPKFANEYGKLSLTVAVPMILNDIPKELLEIRNKTSKMKKIKNYFINSHV